jgi:hypothetical protein
MLRGSMSRREVFQFVLIYKMSKSAINFAKSSKRLRLMANTEFETLYFELCIRRRSIQKSRVLFSASFVDLGGILAPSEDLKLRDGRKINSPLYLELI